VVDGALGRRSFEALVAFETRNRTRADGVLDPAERAALAQQAARQVSALRFQSLRDERSGIRIGVPLALFPKREALPGGTRFSSVDGKASLTLTSGASDATDLPALYQMALQSGPGALIGGGAGPGKITYRVLRPDWFVVTGEIGTGRYYLRQAMTEQGARGYVLRYEAARAAEFDRIAIAVANSFEPVGSPDAAPAVAQSQPSRTSPPGPILTARTGTALRIGAGRYVFPARLARDCKSVTVDSRPASVVKGMGALVFAGTDSRQSTTGLAVAVPTDGPATVLAHADLGAGLALVAVPARLANDRVTGAFQTGVTGAPVIDATGALVGLVAEDPLPARRVGGLLPEASLRLVPVDEVTNALAEARVGLAASSSQGLTSGIVARMWRARLAPVHCSL
jgi:hypothetical protein